MTILSLSKAAIISYVAYSLVFLRGRQILILIAMFFSAIVIVPTLDLSEYHFIARLQALGTESDDNLAVRGYGLLEDMALNSIWGFGEGYYHSISGDEIHSTLGNLLISYGFIGFILFIGFQLALFMISLKATKSIAISSFILLPYFLYGITHNGFRFTSIWLLFGLIAYLKPQKSRPYTLSEPGRRIGKVTLKTNLKD